MVPIARIAKSNTHPGTYSEDHSWPPWICNINSPHCTNLRTSPRACLFVPLFRIDQSFLLSSKSISTRKQCYSTLCDLLWKFPRLKFHISREMSAPNFEFYATTKSTLPFVVKTCDNCHLEVCIPIHIVCSKHSHVSDFATCNRDFWFGKHFG